MYNKSDIKKLPSSPEEFRKQFKMDKEGGTGATSGAGAFSKAKSVDNFQKACIRAFCFPLVVTKAFDNMWYAWKAATPAQVRNILPAG